MSQSPILIFGADGFIGQHLCRLLETKGRPFFPVAGPKASGLDIRDFSTVKTLFENYSPEKVVVLSAVPDAPHSQTLLQAVYETNVIGLGNILEAARLHKAKRVVHIGSAKQYGNSLPPFHETTPQRPQNLYALSKKHAEELLAYFGDRFGISWVSLRPSTVFGPGQKGEGLLLPDLIEKCQKNLDMPLTPGEQKRDFIFVKDLTNAIFAALESHSVQGPYNVGSSKLVSIREVVGLIHRLTKSQSKLLFGALPYREGEILSMDFDSSHFQAATGWTPSYDLERALSETLSS